MALTIYGYGSKVLKQQAQAIDPSYPELDKLITNMWDTMSDAGGCGLAAPQVGQSIKLFVVDSKIVYIGLTEQERKKYFAVGDGGIREAFINAEITDTSPEEWDDTEGCLSLPSLSGQVSRPWTIKVAYQNQYFDKIEKEFSGMTARIIAHEYDHTQGILYIDRVKPLGKKLMESKLKQVLKGKVSTQYKMKFK